MTLQEERLVIHELYGINIVVTRDVYDRKNRFSSFCWSVERPFGLGIDTYLSKTYEKCLQLTITKLKNDILPTWFNTNHSKIPETD